MENQPQLSNLEKAGLIYYKSRKYYSAIFIFKELIKTEPDNLNVWYGLGVSLYICGKSARIKELAETGLGCLKYVLNATNSQHKFTVGFLNKINTDDFLGPNAINTIDAINATDANNVISNLAISEDLLIDEFKSFESNERMLLIIFIGESSLRFYYSVMRYAILEDENKDVKFASLKRINLYKDAGDFEELFEKAWKLNKNEELEPYFAMAIQKIGELWTEKYKGNAYRQLFGNNHNLN